MKIIINAELQDTPQKITPIISYKNFWVNCLAALGYNAHYTPVADLLRRYHGEEAGRWLIMTPVHGRVTHNDAMLVQAGDSFHFSEAQSKIWFEEIKQFLAADHFTLIYHDPAHWLVKLPDEGTVSLPHSPNIQEVLNQSLMPYLAQLDASQYWQRLLTELQMFMAGHPLNTAQHISSGAALSCNGVWFWGGGVLDNIEQTPHFLTDDPVLLALFPHSQLWQEHQILMSQEKLVIVPVSHQRSIEILQHSNHRISCEWYWNNLAYSKKRLSWLQKILNLKCGRGR